MSAPMVRALLAGTKTQTRRLITPQPGAELDNLGDGETAIYLVSGRSHRYGATGDRLWVKETFAAERVGKGRGKNAKARVFYRASCPNDECTLVDGDEIGLIKIERWKPSIFMPRVFSRITLEVESVRAERLHDITEADAKAEGVDPFFTRFPHIGRDQRITDGRYARDEEHRASYACLWDEINGDRALWVINPWVWVVTFKRIEDKR